MIEEKQRKNWKMVYSWLMSRVPLYQKLRAMTRRVMD
jgi:hypothetical protein